MTERIARDSMTGEMGLVSERKELSVTVRSWLGKPSSLVRGNIGQGMEMV